MSVHVLDKFKELGLTPSCILTTPDKPKGRKLILTPNVTKTWAINNNVPYIEVDKFDDNTINKIKEYNPDLFIVASYGKIIPERILNIPKFGSLNIHPSLLPKLRGATPIQQTILEDNPKTAVSIILIDKEMDHGPIVLQQAIDLTEYNTWPMGYIEAEEILAKFGAELLFNNLGKYFNNEIEIQEQDHSQATFTNKITKEDGLIHPEDETAQRMNFLKFKAFEVWPQTYFFTKKNDKEIRVKVNDAIFEDGKMKILKVTPEGQGMMSYDSFLQSIKTYETNS